VKWWVVMAIIVSAGCTQGSEQRNAPRAGIWRSVANWTGRGNATLATFPIAAGHIRVSWETTNESPPGAAAFRVRLHSADSGRVLAEVADQRGIGAATTEITDDHQRFYLTVESANVDWSIRVDESMASGR
jgi:hypothetical protein